MLRLSLVSGFVALLLSAAPVSAQVSGGETLSPEILNTPGAQEIIRNRMLATLQANQLLQQARGPLPTGVAASDPGAVDGPIDRTPRHQQAIAAIRGDAGFLGGFVRGNALSGSRIPVAPVEQQQVVAGPPPLIVNAFGSPVSIGNGNVVQQQVVSSTAISVGGPASATASGTSKLDQRDPKAHGSATSSQSGITSSFSGGAGPAATGAGGATTR